ncbi:hypothetical protein [Deinococcus roseus]|uniref:hypothetical protein n=1 Tax=Deinococcus roseus TaxID=392414 RepID=UPI0016642B73|nr:hypothetical protein [Deinococcus roseus]
MLYVLLDVSEYSHSFYGLTGKILLFLLAIYRIWWSFGNLKKRLQGEDKKEKPSGKMSPGFLTFLIAFVQGIFVFQFLILSEPPGVVVLLKTMLILASVGLWVFWFVMHKRLKDPR